jgi:hypothetical protein
VNSIFLENDEILHIRLHHYLINKNGGTILIPTHPGEQALFWRNRKSKAYFIDEMEVDFTQSANAGCNNNCLHEVSANTFGR